MLKKHNTVWMMFLMGILTGLMLATMLVYIKDVYIPNRVQIILPVEAQIVLV